MSYYCDAEPLTFQSEECRVAMKEHKCCECKKPIPRGEEYIVFKCGWDGTAASYKQHLRCWSFCRFVNLDIIGECGIGFGEMDATDMYSLTEDYPTGFCPEELRQTWLRIRDEGFEYRRPKDTEQDKINSLRPKTRRVPLNAARAATIDQTPKEES